MFQNFCDILTAESVKVAGALSMSSVSEGQRSGLAGTTLSSDCRNAGVVDGLVEKILQGKANKKSNQVIIQSENP